MLFLLGQQVIYFTNKSTIWLLSASSKQNFYHNLEWRSTIIILYYCNTVAKITAAMTNKATEFMDWFLTRMVSILNILNTYISLILFRNIFCDWNTPSNALLACSINTIKINQESNNFWSITVIPAKGRTSFRKYKHKNSQACPKYASTLKITL